MNSAFLQEINHFTIFLENHDGESYNSMMKSLSWIFSNYERDKFYEHAIFETSNLASRYYGVFWSKYSNMRDLFSQHKCEIVSVVAFRLAESALKEFEVGNTY
jgi:hypothetical protein